METDENRAMSVYLRYLANGTPITCRYRRAQESKAADRARQGAVARARSVELNIWPARIATARRRTTGSAASGWVSLRGSTTIFPTWRTSLLAIWDIRQRFQWCQVNIRADELPPDAKEYGDLELYLATQNEGQKLSVPGIRH